MRTILALLLLSTTKALSHSIPIELQLRWIEVTKPYFSTCMCATGVDQTKAINLLAKLELPNDPCLKCFGKCLMVSLGMMTSDGVIIPEAAVVPLQIAQKCTNDTLSISDSCEKSYAFGECLFALLPPV
ncbi:hypothetical protein FQR65_LT05719 [Abscondita terminalis]|nr:hypothetical protein FQR65_LT05719 [Abscondita terminalis]